MFYIGEIVEIRDKNYEFYFQGKPSGNYARGLIMKYNNNGTYNVRLLCNNEVHKIDDEILIKVFSNI
jgi:hypothetical protein